MSAEVPPAELGRASSFSFRRRSLLCARDRTTTFAPIPVLTEAILGTRYSLISEFFASRVLQKAPTTRGGNAWSWPYDYDGSTGQSDRHG